MSQLADALFTRTQQNVLQYLYGRPDKSFYTKEILRLTGMGVHTIKRELDRMVEVGLLLKESKGNQKHYQANPDCPIYTELKSIVDKTFGVTGILAAALEQLFPQVDYAFIYGSIAKGTEHADSDIDLMLVGENLSYSRFMEALMPAEETLGRTINPTILSINEFKTRLEQKQVFLTRVLSQQVLWLKGESECKSRFKEQTAA